MFAGAAGAGAGAVSGERMRLHDDHAERAAHETRRNVYVIFKTVELLEQAYVAGIVGPEAYEQECHKLIARYKASGTAHDDARRMLQEIKVSLPRAEKRLLVSGVPATVEVGVVKSLDPADVAETVHHFISIIDVLQGGVNAIDLILPDLQGLMGCVSRISVVPDSSDARKKVLVWVEKLHAMSATTVLSPDELRQMKLDIEIAYNAFHQVIRAK